MPGISFIPEFSSDYLLKVICFGFRDKFTFKNYLNFVHPEDRVKVEKAFKSSNENKNVLKD